MEDFCMEFYSYDVPVALLFTDSTSTCMLFYIQLKHSSY